MYLRFVAEQDLDRYEPIVGFRIELFERCGGYSLRFVDGQGREVASFPWWDYVERQLRSWTLADIPTGDPAKPYWDEDQCWWLVIWQAGDRVFIGEGEDVGPTLVRAFSVPVADYLAAWEVAMAWCRTSTGIGGVK